MTTFGAESKSGSLSSLAAVERRGGDGDMSDRGEDREIARLAAAAVHHFHREGTEWTVGLPGGPNASGLHALLVEQADKDGRDRLRAAMSAVADLDQGVAMRQAGVDLEEAIAGEFSRDGEFAAQLRTAVLVFQALRGPVSERRPRAVADEGDPISSTEILGAALWVVAAAGSGVLGNAAYDAVKAAFRKHLRGRGGSAPDAGQGAAYSADHLTLIAQLAVQARCGELSIAVPRITALRRTKLVLGESSTTIELAAAQVRATVVVPADGFGSASDISVTLYTAGDA